jgi:opacity protein-like surface antigen
MIALVAAMSVASYGQGAEVTGTVGVVGGIGSHASLGGSIGAPITDRLILSGDLFYIPMGSNSVTVGGQTTNSSASALNFNGNLQYQFNPTHSVVPYAGAGIGLLRTSAEVSTNNPLPNTIRVSASSTDAYFNFGGGLRYNVKPNWGFRPEFMFFAGSNTFVRFAGGIFYQFGE